MLLLSLSYVPFMERGRISYDSESSNDEYTRLRDHTWLSSMDTSDHDLVRDFFEPALNRAIRYDRAVGYFSSGWLRANAKGMLRFAANGGRGRWVTSPILGEADWNALQSGEAARTDSALRETLNTQHHGLSGIP